MLSAIEQKKVKNLGVSIFIIRIIQNIETQLSWEWKKFITWGHD